MKENNRVKKSDLNFQSLKNEAIRIIVTHSNPTTIHESNHCRTQWSKVGVKFIQQELKLDVDGLTHVLQSLVNDRLISFSERKDGMAQVYLQR